MTDLPTGYPATLEIDYPELELNRLTTLFRPITVIPIALVLGLVGGGGTVFKASATKMSFQAGGIVCGATVLMLLFRRKYPRWWFDWNLALTRFGTRVAGYLALLTDRYPSTDEEQSVHLDIRYPDATALSPWLPLVKWILAIPHYLALLVLGVAAVVVVVVAWVAILFTGRYPRPLFDFVVGVLRWGLRVSAYAVLLTTDRYPPFTLSA